MQNYWKKTMKLYLNSIMIDNEIVHSLSTSLCASAYKPRHSFERPIICLRCSSLRQHGSTSPMSWVGPVGLSDRDVCYLKLYRLLNMELYGFVADNMQWYEGEKLARKSSRVGVSEEVIMPRAAGRRDGGASRNVMCVLFPLTAVFLFLSVDVTAIQEEQKAVPEQPPQEVKGFASLSLIKCFIVMYRKRSLTRFFLAPRASRARANWYVLQSSGCNVSRSGQSYTWIF